MALPTKDASKFVSYSMCKYEVAFPTGAKEGDRIFIKPSLISKSDMYVIAATSFDDSKANSTLAVAGATYTLYYPGKFYIIVIPTKVT